MNQLANLLNQFSIIASFQGIFLAIALFILKKGNATLNRLLGFMLICFSWSGYYYTLDLMGKLGNYPAIGYTNFLCDFAYNPLIYLYVRKLTVKDYKLSRKTFIHFIPAVLLFIYYANYYFAPIDQKTVIMSRGYNYFPWDVAIFSYANLLQFMPYLLFSFILLQRYGERLTEYYSDIKRRNYQWLKFIVIYNTVAAVLCFFLYGTMLAIFGQILSVIGALLVYIIGYKMISSPPHLPELELNDYETPEEEQPLDLAEEPTPIKYGRSGLSEERSRLIAEKLSLCMQEQKPFLEPELNLKQLSDYLKIQPHHLSQVINQQTGKNFYDYINEYRVEEVKMRLKNEKYSHLTLLAIAFDSGFNSKASFNGVFKKLTGKSPSEFKRDEAAVLEKTGIV